MANKLTSFSRWAEKLIGTSLEQHFLTVVKSIQTISKTIQNFVNSVSKYVKWILVIILIGEFCRMFEFEHIQKQVEEAATHAGGTFAIIGIFAMYMVVINGVIKEDLICTLLAWMMFVFIGKIVHQELLKTNDEMTDDYKSMNDIACFLSKAQSGKVILDRLIAKVCDSGRGQGRD